MVKEREKETLIEQMHTKYWLYKRVELGYLDMTNIWDEKLQI